MEWISVKDRLPEELKPVLISIDINETYYKRWCNMEVAFLEEKDILDEVFHEDVDDCDQWPQWRCRDGEVLGSVTHWMPLPEPPKEY